MGNPAEPASEASAPDPVAEPTLGFRVQLYSFTNRASAEAALKQVEQALAEWSYGVYVDEESNSFKVRVGDFMGKGRCRHFARLVENQRFCRCLDDQYPDTEALTD